MHASPPDPPQTLLAVLRALPPRVPLLRAGELRLSAEQILTRAEALRRDNPQAEGRICILQGLAPLELLVQLVAWDGFCRRILLLPAALDARVAERLTMQEPPCSEASPGATAWLLATSGTTGAPKLIAHSLASLSQSLKRDVATGSHFRWGLVYDPARFAGLQVALQAFFSGAELVLTPPEDFDGQVSALVAARINALSATPTLWRKLIMDGRVLSCPLRQITLGGEIADQKLLAHLRRSFPAARITHIYASTEAGVGFAVTDGRAGFPLAFVTQGTGRTRLRIDQGGRLWLRPAVLPRQVPPESLDAEGFINSQDLVEVRGDRAYFLGRESGVINVGGNKVHPEAVEGVLRELPGILEARVSGKKNPLMGEIVVAEVVTDSGIGDERLRRAILDHCRPRLEPWQVPALVRFVDQLGVLPAGKLSRTGASS